MISLKEHLNSVCKLNTGSTSDKLKLILVTGAGVAVGYFVYLTGKIYLNHRKYSHIPGPKNKGILGFYFGQGLNLMDHLTKGEIFADVVVEYVEKYGPVVKLNVLSNTIVYTVEPEAIKEILINGDAIKNPMMYEIIGFPLGERFLGRSMVTDVDDDTWRKKRALFNPAFHRQELKTYMSEFNSTADVLINRLRNMADGKTPILLHEEISHAAMDMISNIAFGLSLDSLNDPDNKLSYYVNYATKTINEILLDPFAKINPAKWPKIREFKENLKKFRNFARVQIERRMREIRDDETPRNDILTFILRSQNNKVEDMEAMIDEFIQFFFAGHETTAGTLAFLFMEVGRNKEVYEKLKKEIDEVMGSKPNLLYEDLNKLEYTACVLKETLRLHPAAPQFSRQTTKEMQINGFRIPKGTWIAAAPYVSQRQARFFPDPLKFNPDRFINEATNHTISLYTYFPFSLGPRNCIGQTFAQIEAKVIIAKIIQNFDVELDMTQSFDSYEALTIKPKGHARCFLKLRN